MVMIKRIHVKNFRSLVDETIELGCFNFFVGKNDSGKSNVLKALNLFFNNRTDFDTPFDFLSDYSKFAKRGAKQAKEITISLEIEMPDSFTENGIKVWTKVWRADGLHDNNLEQLFGRRSKGITLLNRIQYLYIPAIKSNEYFRFLLSEVYNSMTKTADSSLKDLNNRYSKQLQSLTIDLSIQLKNVLKLNSAIQMPKDLNVLFRDLTFQTSDDYVKGIDLNHRGDGIKARHIPSILRYMQKNIEANKPKNAVISSFIWGFEEPENGVEYLSCFEMADELYSYRSDCQLLITTHSPAFYMKSTCTDVKCYFVHKNDGASKYTTDVTSDTISEEMGLLPLVSPYIERERKRYLEQEQLLRTKLTEISQKYKKVTDRVIIITEGKTDIKHIKIAFANLNLDPSIISRIDYYDFGRVGTLGDSLNDLLNKLSNMPNTNIIIGIFDRDKHTVRSDSANKYTALKNSVYKFSIPALSNTERSVDDKICIEHYYSNSEIETATDFGHLYMAKDFNDFGVSSDNRWVFHNFSQNNSLTPISIIDGANKHLQKIDKTATIITKDDFADYIINHPNDFDFSNFLQIYNVICSIIADANR